MAKRIQVGGRIESKEVGGIVTGAAEILDDAKGKKQSVINGETDDELVRLDQSKQDNLTFDNAPTEGSDNPVKSGGVYAADKALSDAIEAILLLIPSAASALNKLVDTAMMNSSISTATATFRGTYNVVTDLSLTVDATHEQIAAALGNAISTADNNDYAFVQVPVSATSTDIRRTERYKFNGTVWGYEYDLNTSGFTAAQWAAINSGITLALVGKLIGLPTSSELQALLGQKQDTLTFDNVPTAGSANPVKSGGVHTAINDEKTAREQLAQTVNGINGRVENVEEVIPTGAAANNKLVANNSMEAYVTSIIEAITASFTIATADGHINLTLTQTNGRVASLTLTSSDIASAQALTALTGRVSTAESDITSLGGRVSTNETDIANLQQLYNDLQQSKPVPVTALPETGQQQGVIYRLAGTTSYSDYMWNGSTWVLMATYNNAIDDEPTAGSDNLVKSGGVWQSINEQELINNAIFGIIRKTVALYDNFSVNFTLYDGYIDLSGNPVPSVTWWKHTDNISVELHDIIVIDTNIVPNTVLIVSAYDQNGALISQESFKGIGKENATGFQYYFVKNSQVKSVIVSYDTSFGQVPHIIKINQSNIASIIGNYDKVKAINGLPEFAGTGYIDNNGVQQEAAWWHRSVNIPVHKNDIITLTTMLNPAVSSIAAYDSNNNYIRSKSYIGDSITDTTITYTVPSDISYVVFSLDSSSNENRIVIETLHINDVVDEHSEDIKELQEKQKENNLSLYFSKILCIGDSLTEGDFGSYPEGTLNLNPPFNYPYFLKKMVSTDVDNKGKSGWSTKDYWDNKGSVLDVSINYDCIYIYLGTNGGLTDTVETDAPGDDYHNYDTSTQTGCYCALVSWLKETYQNARIYLINFSYGRFGVAWSEQMSAIVAKIAQKFNIHVIDMMNKSPFKSTLENARMYRPVGIDAEIAATGSSMGNLHFGHLGYLEFAITVKRLTEEIINKDKISYAL